MCVIEKDTNKGGFSQLWSGQANNFFYCQHETLVVDAITLLVSHLVKVGKDG
jgi:hypothetical protein